MKPVDIKSLSAFQKAIKPWRLKHKSTNNPITSNDFKLVKTGNRTQLLLGTDEASSVPLFVCSINSKYLRTHLYFIPKGTILKTSETYKQRRKGLDAFIDNINALEWEKGIYHSIPCLYASDVWSFVEIYKKLDDDSPDLTKILLDAREIANQEYHSGSGQSFLSDSEFDTLEEYIKINKLSIGPKTIGAPVRSKNVVKLPNEMPSLEFEKTIEGIKKWIDKNKITELVSEPKVDGISLQLVYKSGRLHNAFIRGDGIEAEDKLYIAQHIPAIPKTISVKQDVELRVEAIMYDDVFAKKYSKLNGGVYKTARNLVAGLFNRKIADKAILKDVKILAFKAFKGIDAKIHTAELAGLKSLGFATVPATILPLDRLDSLPKILRDTRSNWPYSMDGLVLLPNNLKEHDRIGLETNSSNPKFSRAFKPIGEDQAQTTVKSVRWTLGDTGYLTPTAMLEPIDIKGVTVGKANCFTAKYVLEERIGVGAKVLITRRGDVIPYIEKVVEPALKADIKDAGRYGAYDWATSRKVDYKLLNPESNNHVLFLQLVTFFKVVGVEYFDEASVKKFFDAGYKTPAQILSITDKELKENIEGFKDRGIQRLRSEFAKLKDPGIDLPTLMYASRRFGRGLGKDKLKLLYEHYGANVVTRWKDMNNNSIAKDIEGVRGFSLDTGLQFAQGIQPFLKFAKSVSQLIYIKTPKKASSSKLNGIIAYLTGFRNPLISDYILDQSGKVASSMGNSVNLLLVKNKSTSNDKTIRAKKQGITIMLEDEFINKYMKG